MTRNPDIHLNAKAIIPGADPETLRWILAICYQQEEIMRFLPSTHQREMTLWPSSVFRLAAEHIARSETLWSLCNHELQSRLSPWLQRYEALTPWEVCCAFYEAWDLMNQKELGALLWSLVHRREPMLNKIIMRIQEESTLLLGQNTFI
jgi:hypothetical protein